MTHEEKLIKQEMRRQKRIEAAFFAKRYEEEKKSIAETDGIKLSISDVALDLLEELGFDRSASGTEYLADVIETLYHERRIFESESKFFDFNDRKNNHYIFSNDYYECGLKNLQKAIDTEVAKSYVKDSSLNDIIYGVVNDIIGQYDRTAPRLVRIPMD